MNTPAANQPTKNAALGWRCLALFYDLWPALALCLLLSAVILALRPDHQAFAPWSYGQLITYFFCWLLIGAYTVLSWWRGGQTLGMRPWRLVVLAADGSPANLRALCLRYCLSTLSLAMFFVGFLWSLIDKQDRALHDIGSRTMLLRKAR